MTFDPNKVPGGDVLAWGRECRAKALAGVDQGNSQAVHDWTKSWIGWGGGAWLPDTWILYGVAGILDGKPRNAVHGLDLGIRTWLTGASDRAAFTWLRGIVVKERLNDPKTAVLDLRAARDHLPGWLSASADARIAECETAAGSSRKRAPSVKPRPDHVGPASMLHAVAPPIVTRADGQVPDVWSDIGRYFEPLPMGGEGFERCPSVVQKRPELVGTTWVA